VLPKTWQSQTWKAGTYQLYRGQGIIGVRKENMIPMNAAMTLYGGACKPRERKLELLVLDDFSRLHDQQNKKREKKHCDNWPKT
jgi:hypothetical protein